MNIFATNICPITSAYNLDDKRLIKMVIESAQLLSTAIFLNSNIVHHDIYKPTHQKHPCTIWASLNRTNWDWLFEHFQSLCSEYTFRYNKKHKTAQLVLTLAEYSKYLPHSSKITPFPNCTKSKTLQVDFTNITDTHEAYQKYLTTKWQYDQVKPKWTNRSAPIWYK